ncbi:expressed unknown protein [Seminavis robusta]|uniref:Uncharacterized protein n=1 Tax=Seminavis robusta TaxID=568900 RepID=A0A9N8DF30_9STRA|nr:expressed unknown protein [Seminavis robusta]|eukprot:Sro126_g060600.1 n/a (301) ;mRNA; r:83862-84764
MATIKGLLGVTATHSLLSLYDECLSVAKKEQRQNAPLLTTVSSDSSQTQQTLTCGATKPLLVPLSLHEAQATLLDFDKTQWNAQSDRPKYLPIGVIRSMRVLLQHCKTANDATTNDGAATTSSTVDQLEQALGETQIYFTPPPQSNDNDSYAKRKFRERMERLRLQNEETNYYKMTSNVGGKKQQDDDITTKSMTYAASVGLNMIVAPISFGVFMFFFSGPVLRFVWKEFKVLPGGTDIRKVIIGVISGVAMLFIEMILFVIRTHELDRAMIKKQKKKGTSVQPFGEYSSVSKKTYGKEE